MTLLSTSTQQHKHQGGNPTAPSSRKQKSSSQTKKKKPTTVLNNKRKRSGSTVSPVIFVLGCFYFINVVVVVVSGSGEHNIIHRTTSSSSRIKVRGGNDGKRIVVNELSSSSSKQQQQQHQQQQERRRTTSSPSQNELKYNRSKSSLPSPPTTQIRSGSTTTTTTTTPTPSPPPSPKQQQEHAPLFLIRLLFLSFYASLGSLLPYLPVYYHTLGHDGLSIGLIGAVKPITTFIVAPLWGILSDKAHCLHRILQLTFVSGLLLQLSVAINDGFYWLTLTCFAAAVLNAPVKSLMDCMVMDSLEDKSKYGQLRLWGQVGFGLGSSGVGILLSRLSVASSAAAAVASSSEGGGGEESYYKKMLQTMSRGYKLAFVAHGLLAVPSFVCMRAFQRLERLREQQQKQKQLVATETEQQQQQLQQPKKRRFPKQQQQQKNDTNPTTTSTTKDDHQTKILQGINLLMHSPDAILFFFLVLIVGLSSGIIENFAYVRMREVGGTGREMGISRLVSSAAGAPMFWYSGMLTEKLGADKVLVLSLVSYVVRFFIYACMRHALEGLAAEALRGVTFAAFWSTGTVYAHRISPEGMSATMLMFLNAMYGGLGQSLGAIIGGKLQSKVGTVKTFIYSGIFDLVFVCFIVSYLGLKGGESSFKNPKHLGSKEVVEIDEGEDAGGGNTTTSKHV